MRGRAQQQLRKRVPGDPRLMKIIRIEGDHRGS
jgi:hypothetical protein